MSEFQLIEQIRAITSGSQEGVQLGIGDDAALLDVPAGLELVTSMDTLNEGIHFATATSARDIGHKSLAVNLSDLAAMGARPAWCLLSLSLPSADPDWVASFVAGFGALAREHGVALVGGDTCGGPLSITVTVMGLIEPGHAMKRRGAAPDDLVWVSGIPGMAALALRMRLSGQPVPDYLARSLDCPKPALFLGQELAGLASACIDVSDGLLADLGHICQASNCGAELSLDKLPSSRGFDDLEAGTRWRLQLSGGDDYGLCFTSPAREHDQIMEAAERAATPVTVIGVIREQKGIRCTTPDGGEYTPTSVGFRHFGEGLE
jgi:thiamine-monophosphate kinase